MKKKKKRALAPLPPDGPPEALDLAAHLKLLGDSITKMGEITGEVRIFLDLLGLVPLLILT